MDEKELRRYYRTLVTCHSELCWVFEEMLDEAPVRKLVKHFRDELQRVEEELDWIEQAKNVCENRRNSEGEKHGREK